MSPTAAPQADTAPRFIYYGPERIRAVVGFEDVIEPVAQAFADFSRGLGASPVAVFAPAGRDGDVHVKSAWLPGRGIFTVKVATWFAARAARGLPLGGGVVAAFDSQTGDLRALLEDDHHLSDIRTAAAGLLAARLQCRHDAATIGVLGTGVQAYLQTLAAAAERPIRAVRIWGRHRHRGESLARALRKRRPDLEVGLVSTPRAACEGVDLLVTATASTEPLVQAAWLAPGIHVTAVGADDSAKCELAPECFARAGRIVVDSRILTVQYGDVARAIANGVIGLAQVSAELGQVLVGDAPGRTSASEITVCKLVGLGVQDLAAAEVALALLESGVVPRQPPASVLDLREAPKQ